MKMRSTGTLMHAYHALLERFGPQGWWPAEGPFEVMAGAILTQNTSWTNVERAITALKNGNCLDPRSILQMEHRQLASLIRPSGYFNVKAARLRAFVRFFSDNYSMDIRKMKSCETSEIRNALLGINGIGPETADSILLYALEKPVFVIDAYTKRITARMGIVNEAVSYNELQSLFHSHARADVKLYNEYHALLVRLGKEHCRPRPLCDDCPLLGQCRT